MVLSLCTRLTKCLSCCVLFFRFRESNSCSDIQNEQASTWQVFNKARSFFANPTSKEEGEDMTFSEGDQTNEIESADVSYYFF